MEATKKRFISREYWNPRVLFMFPLGFALGLSYLLISSTLCCYLKSIGMGTSKMGFLLFIANIPLIFKIFWSSIIENTKLKWIHKFGNFRAFLFFGLIGVSIFLFCMSLVDPLTQFYLFGVCLFMTSLSFSMVDNASGGIRVHILPPELLPYGTSLNTLGFRIGLLTSGAGSLFLADFLGSWQLVYMTNIALLFIPALVVLFFKKTLATIQLSPKVSGVHVWERLKNNLLIMKENHFSRQPWVKLYFFFFAMKVFDTIMNVFMWSFFKDLQFTNMQISMGILPGFLLNILGVFIAGEIQSKANYKKGLYLASLMQIVFSCFLLYMTSLAPTKFFLFSALILGNFISSFSLAVLYTFYSLIVTKDNASLQFSYLTALSTTFKTLAIYLGSLFFDFFAQQWNIFFIVTAGFALFSFLLLTRIDSKVATTTPETASS